MAENKTKEVAELLGVELNVPFNIKDYTYNPCKLTENRFINSGGNLIYSRLFQLLTGEMEIEKPILTEKEKCYLEDVLEPFEDRFMYVEKAQLVCNPNKEFIRIVLSNDSIPMPCFEKCTMYKGMELNKEYTLEELGLFEEE